MNTEYLDRLQQIAQQIRSETGMNRHDEHRRKEPAVVTLLGSTRFVDVFRAANFVFTKAGLIVLSIGCDEKTDNELGEAGLINAASKRELDVLHRHKIDMSDAVCVLNVGGYIGESTYGEVRAAKRKPGKGRIFWLEELPMPIYRIVNEWLAMTRDVPQGSEGPLDGCGPQPAEGEERGIKEDTARTLTFREESFKVAGEELAQPPVYISVNVFRGEPTE